MRHLDNGKFWNIFYCHHPCDSYFWLTLSPQSLYKLCIDTYSLPHAHLTSRTLVRLTFINYDNNWVKMKFMGHYWFLHFVQKLGSYNRWLLKVIISIKSWSGRVGLCRVSTHPHWQFTCSHCTAYPEHSQLLMIAIMYNSDGCRAAQNEHWHLTLKNLQRKNCSNYALFNHFNILIDNSFTSVIMSPSGTSFYVGFKPRNTGRDGTSRLWGDVVTETPVDYGRGPVR